MKKRILSLLLVLALCAALLPAVVLAEDGAHSHCVCGASHKIIGDHANPDGHEFEPWDNATKLPDKTGYYYLTRPVSAARGWNVPENVEIVLCLNGYTISTESGTYGTSNMIYIPEGSKLTLTDCSDTQSGLVTSQAKGPCVKNKGTFLLFGGSIANCNTIGVSNVNTASATPVVFTMYGGSVRDNTHTGAGNSAGGGGVENIGNSGCPAEFTMYGGSITGNRSATGGGGGVLNGSPAGVSKLLGGEITGNSGAWGAGVENYASGQIVLGGDIRITGNVVDGQKNEGTGLYEGETRSNLLLGSGSPAAEIAGGGLRGGASIGVTVLNQEELLGTANSLAVTADNSGDYSGHFFADDSAYATFFDKNTKSVRLQEAPDVAPDWAVARIGTTKGEGYYESLKAAVDGAAAGDTIRLLKKDSSAQMITINKSLTIDLCGHKLSKTRFKITSGNVVLKDSENDGSVSAADKNSPNNISSTINSNREAGFEIDADDWYSNYNPGYSTIYVTGDANVTLENLHVRAPYHEKSQHYYKAVFLGGNNARLTIRGGSYVGQAEEGVDGLFFNNSRGACLTIESGFFYAKCGMSVHSPVESNQLVFKSVHLKGSLCAFFVNDRHGTISTVAAMEDFIDKSVCDVKLSTFTQKNIELVPHVHSLSKTEKVEATCTVSGNREYWSCESCGKQYADRQGTQELQSVTTEPTGHSFTYSASGASLTKKCTKDDYTSTGTLVFKESGKTRYSYDEGNEITPAKVTYTGDDWGESRPTLGYSENKNVGTAKATLSYGGATAELAFEIIKADQRIAAPTAKTVGATTVTLNENARGCGTTRYTCSTFNSGSAPGAAAWQQSTTFTGLAPETIYYFYASYDGDTNHNAAYSTGTAVTTKKEAKTVQITYRNTEGAEDAGTLPATYTTDQTLTIPELKKDGYEFKGWKRGENEPQKTLTLMPWSVDANLMLTAEWTAVTYRISYELNGGTLANENPGSYTIETPDFTLNNPTRAGYIFLGWMGTGLNGSTVKTVTVRKGSTGDRSYRAVWTPEVREFAITYVNTEGAEGADRLPTQYTSNADTQIPNLEKTGYVFEGWRIGSGAAQKGLTLAAGRYTGPLTLTAVWTPVEYTITYDLGGGTLEKANPKHYTIETESFTLQNPVRAGFVFLGWSGTEVRGQQETVEIRKGSTGDRSYQAVWMFVPALFEGGFEDVHTYDYFYDAVKWGAERGIAGGVSARLFAPEGLCTRAQVVTFLYRAAGEPGVQPANAFKDVPADAYYAKAVAWAVKKGVTTGTSADTFSPDAVCTRAEAVTFLYRALRAEEQGTQTGFQDVAPAAWYAPAVRWAVRMGVANGSGDGRFLPDAQCTRAQIMAFIYRAYR